MKKIFLSATVLTLLFLTTFQLSAREKKFVLGGEVDWESVTQKVVNLNFTEGLYGYDAYGISAKTHKMNEDTDLYVSFEENPLKTEPENTA